MNKLKIYFPVIFVILLLFFVLKPAINLPLPVVTYVDLEVVVADFGNNLSFFHPPLKYYVYHYGTQFTSIFTVYKLFGFNPLPWFIIDIFLRISAAVAIYLFIVKWTKSKLAGSLAAIFFGVNLPGLQPTTRVAFFLVYGAVILLFIFLNRWLKFHYQPTVRNLTLSVLFFALAILTYPIRMVGTIPLIAIGEIYWLSKHYHNKAILKLQIKHILILIFVALLFVFVTGTLSSTPELSFKRISAPILLTALLTGYPPVVTTLWLFISNIIISPASSLSNIFSLTILQFANSILLFVNIIFFGCCILRKKFLLAFVSLTAVTFSFFVAASFKNLAGWDNNLVVSTQIGGSLFILSNLFLLYFRNKNQRLADIGILGSIIVLSFILFPWLISPEKSNNDQSAFNFIHRYYTIPSAGIGILFGSVIALSWDWFKDSFRNLKLKNIIFAPIPLSLIALILYSLYWNTISTNKLLASIGEGTDASRIELFWNNIDPLLKNIKEPPAINYIYINNISNLDNKYITEMMVDRIMITRKMVYNPPKVNLIFTQLEFTERLNKKNPDDTFYAFQFDGHEITTINKFETSDEIIKQ